MTVVAIGRYISGRFGRWSKALKISAIGIIGFFPLIYYGSWNLYPGIPAAEVGSLASYARYWLPLYMAMVVGVIIFLRLLSRRGFTMILVGGLVLSQLTVIIMHPVAGLSARFKADQQARLSRQAVLNDTTSDSLIIAGAHDKYLADQRMVGFSLPSNPAGCSVLKSILAQRPVYLYATLNQYNYRQLNLDLAATHLMIKLTANINTDQLWEIKPQ